MARKLELAIGVLNGAIGDYLARTRNGLATPMQCIHRGAPLAMDRAALASAHPAAAARVVILVHGVMCTEDIWAFPDGDDYGSLLERDLGLTPLYLRYNSGLAIPDNGTALAALLEALVEAYPVPLEEIVLLGFSMGGLVARSACHAATLAGQRWLGLVKRAIYVGTPHRGAPLERLGRTVARLLQAVDDPYTRLIAELAELRSDGVKDLGDADLRHQDRARRVHGLSLRDPRHPVPLLPQIEHHLVAGTISQTPWLNALFGDSIVPLASATDGAHARPEALLAGGVRILPGVAHMGLAHHREVYGHIRDWCSS